MVTIFIFIGGLGLLFNGLSTYFTVKFLKNKGADSETKAVKLDGLGIWSLNWVMLAKNSQAVLFKNKNNEFWYSPEKQSKMSFAAPAQIIFGVFMVIASVALIAVDLARVV